MHNSELLNIVTEAALHAFVAQRCQRAYVHELRNGLQGIYASLDVLLRLADGGMSAAIPVDKVKEIARKSLQSHEQGINQAVKQLSLQAEEPTIIDIGTVLRRLVGFLGNDAAAHEVAVNLSTEEGLTVDARPGKFRLALLAVLVHAIDSMRGGGQLAVSATRKDAHIDIELSLMSNDASLAEDRAWLFDAGAEFDSDWIRSALARLVKKEGGTIESSPKEAPREAGSYSSHRVVRLTFHAANPSSFDNRA